MLKIEIERVRTCTHALTHHALWFPIAHCVLFGFFFHRWMDLSFVVCISQPSYVVYRFELTSLQKKSDFHCLSYIFLLHIIKMFNVEKIANNIIIIKETSYKKIAKKWHTITSNHKIMIGTTNAAAVATAATQLQRRWRKISKSTVARAVAKRTKAQDMNANILQMASERTRAHRQQRMRSWEMFFFIHRLAVCTHMPI